MSGRSASAWQTQMYYFDIKHLMDVRPGPSISETQRMALTYALSKEPYLPTIAIVTPPLMFLQVLGYSSDRWIWSNFEWP